MEEKKQIYCKSDIFPADWFPSHPELLSAKLQDDGKVIIEPVNTLTIQFHKYGSGKFEFGGNPVRFNVTNWDELSSWLANVVRGNLASVSGSSQPLINVNIKNISIDSDIDFITLEHGNGHDILVFDTGEDTYVNSRNFSLCMSDLFGAPWLQRMSPMNGDEWNKFVIETCETRKRPETRYEHHVDKNVITLLAYSVPSPGTFYVVEYGKTHGFDGLPTRCDCCDDIAGAFYMINRLQEASNKPDASIRFNEFKVNVPADKLDITMVYDKMIFIRTFDTLYAFESDSREDRNYVYRLLNRMKPLDHDDPRVDSRWDDLVMKMYREKRGDVL